MAGLSTQLALLNTAKPAIGLPTQSPKKFDFGSLVGPISKGFAVVGGVFDALAGFEAAGSYRSQARQYKRAGRQALEQGFTSGMDIAREGAGLTGSMLAGFGKSGSLMEGSPLLVMADTQYKIDEDIRRVIEQGRILKADYDYKAKQAKKAAKAAKRSGIAGIVGSIGGQIPGLIAGLG